MKEQNVVTNEQAREAREAIDRILNFCEEIDNHIPTDEKTGYKMLPDYFIVSRYLNEACYRKQKEGEWVYRENEFGNAYYACSICDCQTRYKENYCSSCGAKMKGGAE